MMRTTLDVAIAKPGGVPAQTRELDAELRVDLDHADQLLESFLTLARAQNGQLDEHTRVALEPLITRRAQRPRRPDRRQGAHGRDRISPRSRSPAAPRCSRRMIENVIENAVRHNQPGGSIELSARTTSTDRGRE